MILQLGISNATALLLTVRSSDFEKMCYKVREVPMNAHFEPK